MKKRRVLAGLMGVLAAVGAAATLQLGLTAPGKETAVLKMDPRVMEQAQEFLVELSAFDLEGASAYILGSPKLTAQGGEGTEKILWTDIGRAYPACRGRALYQGRKSRRGCPGDLSGY